MKRTDGPKGFSLIEAVVVLTIVAIVSFGLANFIVTLMSSYILISDRDAAAGKARSALNRMLAEIRRANTTQNITTFTTAELQFVDIDGQTIDFRQAGPVLYRNTATLETNLITPAGLCFTYLGPTGEVTAVKNNIRTVRVWLFLSGGTQRITLESSARIRNL